MAATSEPVYAYYGVRHGPVEPVLASLLNKAYQGGQRAMVYAPSAEDAVRLTQYLWAQSSFLPCGTDERDPHPEHQPIWLSHHLTNRNNADCALSLTAWPKTWMQQETQAETPGFSRFFSSIASRSPPESRRLERATRFSGNEAACNRFTSRPRAKLGNAPISQPIPHKAPMPMPRLQKAPLTLVEAGSTAQRGRPKRSANAMVSGQSEHRTL